jgi:SAM-dependent methyltransferase
VDDVAGTYDLGAEEYARALPDLRAETTSDLVLLSRFAMLVRATGHTRVADVGCGYGRLTDQLRELGLDPIGTDISPGMLAIARRNHPDALYDVAPIGALPYPDSTVGGVLSWYSIIHTSPSALIDVFAEWRRVLAPGGLVLLGFQHGGGTRPLTWATRLGRGLEARLQTVSHVTEVLRSAGYMVIDSVVRAPEGAERQPQGFVLARAPQNAT